MEFYYLEELGGLHWKKDDLDAYAKARMMTWRHHELADPGSFLY
jgi:hypothetical protein